MKDTKNFLKTIGINECGADFTSSKTFSKESFPLNWNKILFVIAKIEIFLPSLPLLVLCILNFEEEAEVFINQNKDEIFKDLLSIVDVFILL